MAVTHVTALRNVLADAVDNYINTTGVGTAKVELRDGSTPVVQFDLANPAFGAAVAGLITLNGVPIADVGIADGDVDNARIYERNGGNAVSCSVTGLGGGGDIEVSNTNIATGQDCTLDSLTYAAPV